MHGSGTRAAKKKQDDMAGVLAAEFRLIPGYDDLSTDSKLVITIISTLLTRQYDELRREVSAKDAEVKILKTTINKQNTQIVDLQTRLLALESTVEDLESIDRRDDVILSGLNVPEAKIGENLPAIVRAVLRDVCHLNIATTDIRSARRLGRPPQTQGPDKRPVLVTFYKKATKIDAIVACRKTKGGLYANENLIQQRKRLFTYLWNLRKEHKDLIRHLYTLDGIIYVKKTNEGQPYRIRTEIDMRKCLDSLGVAHDVSTNFDV